MTKHRSPVVARRVRTSHRVASHITVHHDARARTMSEETETFAFQAEINQLLTLIINVRRDDDDLDAHRSVIHGVFRARFSPRRIESKIVSRRPTDRARRSTLLSSRRRSIRTRKFSYANSSGARAVVARASDARSVG
jgi:hypothetical protein